MASGSSRSHYEDVLGLSDYLARIGWNERARDNLRSHLARWCQSTPGAHRRARRRVVASTVRPSHCASSIMR